MENVRANDGAGNGKALALGASAFIFWGIMPIYWKLLSAVPAYEIMANRVFWSAVFMAALLVFFGKIQAYRQEMKNLFKCRKKLCFVVAGAFLLSLNWFTYIWAVNAGRIVECSLGYYINPLVNVLIGVTVLRERLSLWQLAAVLLAAAGVLKLTFAFGALPWVALFLAVSMALYGLCKKITGLSAIVGISIESTFTAPMAAFFLLYLYANGQGYPPSFNLTGILLMGAGAATAFPLLLYAYSINRLSMTIIGFLQYIQPCLTLIFGVFIYHEPFTATHRLAFGLTWVAIIIFTLAKTPPMLAIENRVSRFLGRRRA